MTTTTNLDITLIEPGQSGKHLTANAAFERFGNIFAETLVQDVGPVSSPYTLTRFDFLQLDLTGARASALIVEHPARKHFFIARNATGQSVTLRCPGQTGVVLPAGQTKLYYCSGVDVTAVGLSSELSGSLAGDVTGAPTAVTVERIRNVPVAATAPVPGQALLYNGSAWAPGAVATGDGGGGGGGASGPVSWSGCRRQTPGGDSNTTVNPGTQVWFKLPLSETAVDIGSWANAEDGITVPAGISKVRVRVFARGGNVTLPAHSITIYKNGAGVEWYQGGVWGEMVSGGAANSGSSFVSGLLNVAQGDVFDLRIFNQSTTGFSLAAWMEVEAVEYTGASLPPYADLPLDIPIFIPGSPVPDAVVARIGIVRTMTLPAGLVGSIASSLSPPGSSYLLELYRNTSKIGEISISPGEVSFDVTNTYTFQPGDYLSIRTQLAEDPDIRDISITLRGTRP